MHAACGSAATTLANTDQSRGKPHQDGDFHTVWEGVDRSQLIGNERLMDMEHATLILVEVDWIPVTTTGVRSTRRPRGLEVLPKHMHIIDDTIKA